MVTAAPAAEILPPEPAIARIADPVVLDAGGCVHIPHPDGGTWRWFLYRGLRLGWTPADPAGRGALLHFLGGRSPHVREAAGFAYAEEIGFAASASAEELDALIGVLQAARAQLGAG